MAFLPKAKFRAFGVHGEENSPYRGHLCSWRWRKETTSAFLCFVFLFPSCLFLFSCGTAGLPVEEVWLVDGEEGQTLDGECTCIAARCSAFLEHFSQTPSCPHSSPFLQLTLIHRFIYLYSQEFHGAFPTFSCLCKQTSNLLHFLVFPRQGGGTGSCATPLGLRRKLIGPPTIPRRRRILILLQETFFPQDRALFSSLTYPIPDSSVEDGRAVPVWVVGAFSPFLQTTIEKDMGRYSSAMLLFWGGYHC